MSQVRMLGALVRSVLVVTPLAGGDATPHPGEPASPPATESAAPTQVLQVRARELWTSSGEHLKDALLVIADGRVRSVSSAGEPDAAQPLVIHTGVVTAGLIACRSESGTAGELQDDTRSVLSGARAVHAFDPDSRDFERALSAGITSMVLAPSRENLVGGLACVVKTAGGRVSAPEAGLALSLTSAALGRSISQGGFLFGAAEGEGEPLVAGPDGGPEWTSFNTRGTRAPTSYAGALAMLKHLFARPEGPFARAKRGELAVTIEAWDRNEVLRAVQFAQEHKLVGSIRGAPLAGDPEVVAALKASGLGVIVGPYSADQTARSLASVKLLSEAGVPVAFALDAPVHSPEDLRFSAARALRSGATRAAVWKALTEDAARLAGVAETAGSLTPGREADFVLWSGDPLDLSSHVVAVYVDGRLAWSAPAAR